MIRHTIDIHSLQCEQNRDMSAISLAIECLTQYSHFVDRGLVMCIPLNTIEESRTNKFDKGDDV